MFDFDGDMKLTFLEEAQALIDESEAAFMAVDAGDRSPELIDQIFRLAHNFKGSAKTVGLQHLSDFGHAFEEVLVKVKSGQLEPDKTVCTVLLETLDHFRNYVAGLKNDLNYIHDTEMIIAILASLVEAADSMPTPFVSVSNAAPIEESVPTAFIEETLPVEVSVETAASEKSVTEPVKAVPMAKAVVVASAPAAKAPAAAEENIKVNRKKLDTLLDLIGELVVNQSMVTGHKNQNSLESDSSHQTLNSMEKIVHEIQNLSLSLRMTPIAPLFQKMRRIVRDAGDGLNKTIQFQTVGEHVEVDKVVMDQISDPLNHLLRNAVDHGLETDTERADAGKNDPAVITLQAQQQDSRILITISDNGRGMNAQNLITKAKEKGLIEANANISNEEAYNLIFKPGFSTKEKVTDMSGRGVGMDVVQKAVSDLKGHIEIQTELGKGTQFIISLPLSMSILTGMVVRVDQQKYVIPISQLIETVELKKFVIESSTEKGRMFNLRGNVIPIHSLSTILHAQGPSSSVKESGTGLIIAHRGRKFSFEIDEICGQQEIVLKKLGRELQGVAGIVAGAILSTGEPGFVLNLGDFLEGVQNVA